MSTQNTDFSPLFAEEQDASERMLAFTNHVNGLVDALRVGEKTVDLGDSGRVVLRRTEIPVGHGYRKRLPGVEIVDPMTGESLGSVGADAHEQGRRLFGGRVIRGGVHFQPPRAAFSLVADKESFLNPETVAMRKKPFHTAIQALGQAMLELDQEK